MGWASGSSLLDLVADITLEHVPEKERAHVADKLIAAFKGEDCDTICECENEYIAAAYERMNPSEDDE